MTMFDFTGQNTFVFKPDLTEVLLGLGSIKAQLVQVLEELEMAKQRSVQEQAAFDELISQLNTATSAIAAKLAALEQRINTGLSQSESDAVKAQLAALRAQLEALGADPDNPVPTS